MQRILERELDSAFDMFKRNGDIYEFALDMLQLGRRCVKKDNSDLVMEQIFKLERKHPRHMSFKQSARYLTAQGKKK